MADIIAQPAVDNVEQSVVISDVSAKDELIMLAKKVPSTSGDDMTPSTLDGLVISPLTNRHESNGIPPEPANEKTCEVDGSKNSVPVLQTTDEEVTFKENDQHTLGNGSESASAESAQAGSSEVQQPSSDEPASGSLEAKEPANNEPASESAPERGESKPTTDEAATTPEEQPNPKEGSGNSGPVAAETEQQPEQETPPESQVAEVKEEQAGDAPSSDVASDAQAEQAGDEAVPKSTTAPAKETNCTTF
jgi:hypothetical protein